MAIDHSIVARRCAIEKRDHRVQRINRRFEKSRRSDKHPTAKVPKYRKSEPVGSSCGSKSAGHRGSEPTWPPIPSQLSFSQTSRPVLARSAGNVCYFGRERSLVYFNGSGQRERERERERERGGERERERERERDGRVKDTEGWERRWREG